MKKYQLDLTVKSIEHVNEKYVLIKLTDEKPLPEMLPGQFVNIRIDNAETFLRRPISINFVDVEKNELHLLVAAVGEGTKWLASREVGDKINMLLPLGNGFTKPTELGKTKAVLLIGGGVGVAPLLNYGKVLKDNGITPIFLLGARSAKDLLLLDSFKAIGDTFVTTEDASLGDKGFVTNSSFVEGDLAAKVGKISCCGPKPMMVAVARMAKEKGVPCEVSLENMMACGLGACLCCVEKTVKGNVCVCKEGPVFDIENLNW